MRRNGPLPAGSIRVFDAESSQLLALGRTLIEAQSTEDDQHPFRCTEGNGRLLVYFFARGKRDVRVQLESNEGVLAHLGTRWRSGHREWTLEW